MQRHCAAIAFRLVLLGLVAFVPLGSLKAQGGPPQSVALSGGALTLRIDAAVPGGELLPVTDSSTELSWSGGGGGTSKITVETFCPGQSFALYVGAQVTSGQGIEEPEVALVDGMLPADLIRNIPRTGGSRQGTATLTYRAVATVADGSSSSVGDDLHTLTYTITAQ